MKKYILLTTLILIGLVGPLSMAQAQLLPKTPSTSGEAKDAAAVPVEETPDSLGRDTPRGMVSGFLDALAAEDFDKASQYLDLSNLPSSRKQARGAQRAEDFQALLDKGGWFYPSSMLSDDKEGKKEEENLPDDTDKIGSLKGKDGEIAILTQRVPSEADHSVWLIAAETVDQIPALMQDSTDPLINKILPDVMIDKKIHGVPVGHWLGILAILVLSYLSAWFVMKGIACFLEKMLQKRYPNAGIYYIEAFRLPLALYMAVWVFALSSTAMGISIIVRQYFGQLNVIIAWTALALLAWRLIDIFAEAAQRKMIQNGRFFGFSSIVFFFRRIAKFIFVFILIIIILDNLGVNVTAGLAALGIGGIALALGAQKTLENFIGSLAIVLDQPIHIGDYCKVGDVSGTIEDIGMRSTRIRTNDRTLVTVPNGDLSTQRIENYARRNRFLINKKFQIRYDSTSAQISAFVERIQTILFSEEKSVQDPKPVRFLGMGTDGFVIEIFCFINTSDNNDYLSIQERLMLQIVDAAAELGIYFTIPAQTFLPALDQLESKNAAAPQ